MGRQVYKSLMYSEIFWSIDLFKLRVDIGVLNTLEGRLKSTDANQIILNLW